MEPRPFTIEDMHRLQTGADMNYSDEDIARIAAKYDALAGPSFTAEERGETNFLAVPLDPGESDLFAEVADLKGFENAADWLHNVASTLARWEIAQRAQS